MSGNHRPRGSGPVGVNSFRPPPTVHLDGNVMAANLVWGQFTGLLIRAIFLEVFQDETRRLEVLAVIGDAVLRHVDQQLALMRNDPALASLRLDGSLDRLKVAAVRVLSQMLKQHGGEKLMAGIVQCPAQQSAPAPVEGLAP